jgi:competence protein ComEA
LALVCLLTVLATAVVLLRSRPHQIRAPLPLSAARSATQPAHPPSVTATADPSVGPGPAGSGSPPASPNQLLVVDVVGPVRRPGVVRLPPGSRVIDALAAAGGLKPGSGSGMLNLASVVTDGQQVVIGGPAAPTAAPDASGALGGAGATGSASASAVIDLNTATVQQLDELPGVGPVLAQRIVDWRSTNGRFSSPGAGIGH